MKDDKNAPDVIKMLKKTYPEAYAFVDIEVFDKYGDKYWAQARYLVHGYEDVMWTNSLDAAIAFLKESLIKLNTVM